MTNIYLDCFNVKKGEEERGVALSIGWTNRVGKGIREK
jgi:hypothetical protein